eukprot:SAG11_NODE_289_length_11184_cov_20.648083_11_plen_156_part_00
MLKPATVCVDLFFSTLICASFSSLKIDGFDRPSCACATVVSECPNSCVAGFLRCRNIQRRPLADLRIARFSTFKLIGGHLNTLTSTQSCKSAAQLPMKKFLTSSRAQVTLHCIRLCGSALFARSDLWQPGGLLNDIQTGKRERAGGSFSPHLMRT